MSNIPAARAYLRVALRTEDPRLVHQAVRSALALLDRRKPARKARGRRGQPTLAQREEIRRLAAANPNMTIHEIANAVGLHNSGRVSEVLHP